MFERRVEIERLKARLENLQKRIEVLEQRIYTPPKHWWDDVGQWTWTQTPGTLDKPD